MKELKIIKIYFLIPYNRIFQICLCFGCFYEQASSLRTVFIIYFPNDFTNEIFRRLYPLQMLVFYLCFNIVDTIGQLLFREVYRFRSLIVTGGLDMVLVKPLNP